MSDTARKPRRATAPKAPHPADAHAAQNIACAAYFTAYDAAGPETFGPFQGANALAEARDAIADRRRAVVYAVTPGNLTFMVPACYVAGDATGETMTPQTPAARPRA